MRSRKLSCFVIVCNEADRIEACLAPLAGWVDQLIVLDSGSEDNTVALARKYTDEVHETDWPGFGAQRNRALSLTKHEWVLNIDADEVVTERLKEEIDRVLSRSELPYNLIEIPWRTMLLGKPLRFGRYSSPQGKLFNKNGVKFKNRPVHETLEIPSPKIKVLKAPLVHYSWRDYVHLQEKHLQYAALIAEQKYQAGKRSTLAYAGFRFLTDFTQQYLLRLGMLDGWRGFLMAMVLAQYAFNKYAGLVALQHIERTKRGAD
ncbi:MAG: glycosyltransferase family 2 protein [Halieaceae bacterium]|jgi:(heptosyl)LPS beta-1,4-glucosyltransferase|nr:glycosyltransferase family 2 protein [Halieaceae bacterium]